MPSPSPRPAAPGKTAIARWSYLLTVAGAICLALLVALARPPFIPDLSRVLFDSYQRLDPREWDPALPVRIVDIDEESLSQIGQWPWPRSKIAEIVARLKNLGAAAVAIDLVFAEPDASSPEQIINLLPQTPGRSLLEQEGRGQKSNDAILGETIAQANTVLGAILTQSRDAPEYPTKFGLAAAGDDPHRFLPQFSGAVVPLASLSTPAAGIGALNWLPDNDQIVRRVPLLLMLGDKIVPSLALEALRVGQGASTIVVRSSNASGQTAFGAHTGVNTIKVGDLEIPCDAQAELRVWFTHTEPRRFVPAWKVLSGAIARGDIEGRIVVLGTSAVGLRDQRGTPVDASVAGVEVHAQAIEQAVSGNSLVRPDWSLGAELALAVALAVAIAFLLPQVTAVTAALCALAVLTATGWASWHAFAADGILLDPTVPGLTVVLTYSACVVWLYRDEQRRRREVREAFGRYVSPAVVAQLADDPRRLVLGGEIRTLTVMFCDVRGFTALAERFDAQGLTQFMNEYLSAMTDAVLANGGTVDKYIGDALMAFWNAPLDDTDHARHAARAALAMVSALASLNTRRQAAALARGEGQAEIKFGIGLSTGDCCVGNFGSIHRFDYSAMGDQVNLASRLEGATKFYQTDVLASQATRDASPDLAWLEVDAVRVKGKSEITRVHALVGDEATRQSAAFAKLALAHGEMLTAYRGGDFPSAAHFAGQAAAVADARLLGYYALFAERCRALAQSAPENWQGITELQEK